MTVKDKSGGSGPQERKRRAFNKSLDAQARARNVEYARQLKEHQQWLKIRDQELRNILKNVRGTGIYEPKKIKLTPYRRKRARQIEREYGRLLDKTRTFFIPAPSKARDRILERAKSLEFTTTKKGIFVPKEGHATAKLTYDKRHDEFVIIRGGKTKLGINKGRTYTNALPLSSVDELDRERDRLRAMAENLGPTDDEERLVFKVIENGQEGYSHSTFSNIELLLRYLDNYQKKTSSKVNFFRHIQVEKSSSIDWRRSHPVKAPGRKNRRKIDTRGSKG